MFPSSFHIRSPSIYQFQQNPVREDKKNQIRTTRHSKGWRECRSPPAYWSRAPQQQQSDPGARPFLSRAKNAVPAPKYRLIAPDQNTAALLYSFFWSGRGSVVWAEAQLAEGGSTYALATVRYEWTSRYSATVERSHVANCRGSHSEQTTWTFLWHISDFYRKKQISQ